MTDFHFFHPVSSNPHRKPRVCRLISLAVGRIKKPQEKRRGKNPFSQTHRQSTGNKRIFTDPTVCTARLGASDACPTKGLLLTMPPSGQGEDGDVVSSRFSPLAPAFSTTDGVRRHHDQYHPPPKFAHSPSSHAGRHGREARHRFFHLCPHGTRSGSAKN